MKRAEFDGVKFNSEYERLGLKRPRPEVAVSVGLLFSNSPIGVLLHFAKACESAITAVDPTAQLAGSAGGADAASGNGYWGKWTDSYLAQNQRAV